MPDLEAQLRDCLTRHAEEAAPRREMLRGARDRSRQLGRHRQTAAVVAMVPVTAGVVVGAVALTDSSSRPQGERVQTVASASASPTPSAHQNGTSLFYQICATGQVPSLHIDHRVSPQHGQLTTTLRDVIRWSAHRRGFRAYSVVGQHRFALDGRHPGHDALALEIVGDHHRSWIIAISHHQQPWTMYQAQFVSCAPQPSH